MKGWIRYLWNGALFSFLMVLPVACQTSPAVPYVAPAASEAKSGIPLSGIVSDLRKALLAEKEKQGGSLRVAVVRFTTPSGSSRTFGRYLGQKIGELLSDTKGVELIDPGQVYEALHRLGIEQGILDTRALLDVGHEVGADVLIVGTYTDLGQEIDIAPRLLKLPGGGQLGLFSRKIPITPEVLNLIKVGP